MDIIILGLVKIINNLFSNKYFPLPITWLIIAGIFFFVEFIHRAWIIIWFAAGALAASIIAYFVPEGTIYQIGAFFITSFLTLVILGPIIREWVNRGGGDTNVDGFIGKECFVIETIDSYKGKGAVNVYGTPWKATSANSHRVINKNTRVKIVRRDDLTLIVEPVESETVHN